MSIDPRMFAILQAQRQLQQQEQQGHPQPTNGQYPQQQSLYQQQHQQQQQQQQQVQGQQRPGGDADVASFLLQLRTNQNGEPLTDAEALQQLNAATAIRQQSLQQQLPLQQAPATANGVIPGYSMSSIPGMNHLYSYPGMVAAFPQSANPNSPNAFQRFYNPMQPHAPMQHPTQALAPMQQPGGVVPGLNHSQAQQNLGVGMHGGQAPTDTGPVMTDAYIESLISNDVVTNKNKNSYSNGSASSDTAAGSSSESLTKEETSNKPPETAISAKDDMNIALVVSKDRDLIPDALFVALGQMRPCRLQQSDRVGCYKTRALGFLGMACKHCGGQPGFGRYFPNSVRSLAQTTTSQTILKHIGGKCRFCPSSVRKAVLELQRQQAHKEHLTTGRPRYGSRKIFFQRMWTRLHGPSEDGESAKVVQADVTPEQAKEEAAAKANESSNASRLIDASKLIVTTSDPGNKPSPVSNNNSDDEEASSQPPPNRDSGVMSISLHIDNEGGGANKRKISRDGEEAMDEEENSTKKKLCISPVAV